MNVQSSQCIFESHFEAPCHHAADVQTHVSRPRCMGEHFEVEFHLKDKAPHSQRSVSLSHVLTHLCLDGVALSKTSSLFQLSLTSVAIPGSRSNSKMDGVKPITAFVCFPFVGGHSKHSADVSSSSPFYFQETKRDNSGKCLCLSAFVSFQQLIGCQIKPA